jgi:Uma2 family endonuclease
MATLYKPALITADHFGEMHRAGVLERFGRCELWNGAIIEMGPQFFKHGALKTAVADDLRDAIARTSFGFSVFQEVSVRLGTFHEPVPDVVVFDATGLEDGPIPVAAVRLLVEVATNSLDRDLVEKRPAYAAAGVPEYWVVDASARVIHQFWGPTPEGYTSSAVTRFGERITAQAMAGVVLETGGLG